MCRARTSQRTLRKHGRWSPRSAAAGSRTGDGRTPGSGRSPSSCGPTWTGTRTSPPPNEQQEGMEHFLRILEAWAPGWE
eukprot:5746165-Alexandrium_andersonii.AAC.1